MTLTINLPPDVLDRVAEKAKAEGLDAAAVVEQTVAREFAPAEKEDDWDMPYTREEAAANAASLRELFAQWDEEDKDVDPEEARREWEEFKEAMNETRRLEGRPPAYGEND